MTINLFYSYVVVNHIGQSNFGWFGITNEIILILKESFLAQMKENYSLETVLLQLQIMMVILIVIFSIWKEK